MLEAPAELPEADDLRGSCARIAQELLEALDLSCDVLAVLELLADDAHDLLGSRHLRADLLELFVLLGSP